MPSSPRTAAFLSLRTAVGYWRGGDPYDASAARKILGWRPDIDHEAEIERLAR